MILTYKECITKYGSDYKIKKEIEKGSLYQLDKGIYSDTLNYSSLEILMIKYPNAVFSGESACYYYGLTDVIPTDYVLTTKRSDTRIKDATIKQMFVKDELYDIGKTEMLYSGVKINIYSKERLLVDFIRFKQKYPFDYYKEVIVSYRDIINELDFYMIEMYANYFRSKDSIMKTIQLEVL